MNKQERMAKKIHESKLDHKDWETLSDKEKEDLLAQAKYLLQSDDELPNYVEIYVDTDNSDFKDYVITYRGKVISNIQWIEYQYIEETIPEIE